METPTNDMTSPYCPICSGCGEDGCCKATMCQMHPDGHYCETYLKDLKVSLLIKNLHKYQMQKKLK